MAERTVTDTEDEKSSESRGTETDQSAQGRGADTSEESGDDLVEKFEQQYQTEKVLNSSSGVQAEIVDAGWRDSPRDKYVGAVCLLLSVPGGADYPVIIPQYADRETGNGFVALLERLEQSPQRDLSPLEGKHIAIDMTASGGTDYVRIAGSDTIVHGQVVDDPSVVHDADSTVPDAVVSAFTRLARYRREGGSAVRVGDLRGTETELVLDLDGGWGEIRVPVDRKYAETPETPYERLVEHVGQGSVKQIEGGSVHLVHASDVPGYLTTSFTDLDADQRQDLYRGLVTTTTDCTGEWAIFLDTPRRKVSPVLAGGFVLGILLLFAGIVAGVGPAIFFGVVALYGTARQLP